MSSEQDDGICEEFRKYIKMKSMLPEGAVRQKMTADGYASKDIDAFLSGQVASLPPPCPPSAGAPPPRPPLAQMLQQQPTLRSAAAQSPIKSPVQEPRRLSLLDEIQQGPKLRAVVKDDTRMKAPDTSKITGGGGLLGMLAMEMSKRRFNMHQRDDSSDSDSSGFSDSDSDSD